MHAAARQLCNQYGGALPKTPEALRQIKGIGPYTAAAIASIAFEHPIAAIDGNAYRVLSRYFASSLPIDSSAGRKYFQDLGNQLLGDGPSGDFNQALMDVGAGICTPRQPQCTNCPLIDECRAYSLNIQDEGRSEEHTSELQSRPHLVCRLLLEKKKKKRKSINKTK